MPLIHGPWPFAPILPPPTMPRLSAGIIDSPGMGLGSVAIGGTTIGGAPSAVALGAEPPRKRTNGQRGPDRRKRSVKQCKRCKEEQRTEAEQLACAGRLPSEQGGKSRFFWHARRRRWRRRRFGWWRCFMAQLKTLHLNAATQAKPPIATAPFALHAQPLQVGTDPELKGGWIEPPAARRIFPACWDEREAAFGGVCRWPLVVFGSTRPKKNRGKNPAARLGWLFCRWRRT